MNVHELCLQSNQALLCVRSLIYYSTAAKYFLLRKDLWDIFVPLTGSVFLIYNLQFIIIDIFQRRNYLLWQFQWHHNQFSSRNHGVSMLRAFYKGLVMSTWCGHTRGSYDRWWIAIAFRNVIQKTSKLMWILANFMVNWFICRLPWYFVTFRVG